MGYIIAGANLSNADRPAVAEKIDTIFDALKMVSDLQNGGYKVRISTSEGEEVSAEDLKARAAGKEI